MSSHLQDFSEWGQCQVLELASHHRPSGEQEVYDLMNVLDDRLCHSNSAVAMATIKVFLHLTLSMPATHQQARRPLQCTHAYQEMMYKAFLEAGGNVIS